MTNKLLELKQSEKYVSIYANENDTSKFVFGRILSVSEKYFAIYMIAPDGNYDGVLVKCLKDLIRIEIDDKYSNKMKQIIKSANENRFNFSLDNQNIIGAILDIAKTTKKIISLELLNSGENDVVGFVESVNSNICVIKQINEYGEEDGYSYIFLDNITQITYDSIDEQIVLNLWESVRNK